MISPLTRLRAFAETWAQRTVPEIAIGHDTIEALSTAAVRDAVRTPDFVRALEEFVRTELFEKALKREVMGAGLIVVGGVILDRPTFRAGVQERARQEDRSPWATWLERVGTQGPVRRVLDMTRPQLLQAAARREETARRNTRVATMLRELAARLPDDQTPVRCALSTEEIGRLMQRTGNPVLALLDGGEDRQERTPAWLGVLAEKRARGA